MSRRQLRVYNMDEALVGIRQLLSGNLGLYSFEHYYRIFYLIVIHKHGDELYSWIVGLTNEHIDEVQRRIVSTLYAGDISSFDVQKIVENVWMDYSVRLMCMRDAFSCLNHVYCKMAGKELVHDAGKNLFRRKIELVFPIQVQGRLASALLRQVQPPRSSLVQIVANIRQDSSSISFEDSASIKSTSLVCNSTSSDVQIINARLEFMDPYSGDTVCILPFEEFSFKRSNSLVCEDYMIDETMIDTHDHSQFFKKEPIGEGGFGLIYGAEWEKCKEKVVLKYVKSNGDIKNFIKEMKIHQKASGHNNIIPFYGMAADLTNQHFAMILQYADGGNLREYLARNFNNLTWSDKVHIAHEINEGLLWLHNKKIIHRDLHSKNVLVHKCEMRISDFGLSEMIGHSMHPTFCGIPAYTEPQLFIYNEYHLDEKSDVYSLGVLLWEISSGRVPFDSYSPECVITAVSNNIRETPVHGTPSKYECLYQECWQQDPQLRPTTEEVFNRLKSISIDSVTETQILRDVSNSTLPDADSSPNRSSRYEECDDFVNELDINDYL